MTLQEMTDKIKSMSKMAKSCHIFRDKPDKALLVLYKFENVTDENRGRLVAGMEMDKDQVKRLIQNLTQVYRQMERDSLKTEEKKEEA